MGIRRTGDAGSDPIGLEELLKFKTGKFGALVVKTAKGSGVATEPGAVEGAGDSAAFFVGKSKEFHEVSGRVNHGECQDGNWLATGVVGTGRMFGRLDGRLRDNPRSDEIDMDFFPRIEVAVGLDG